MNQEHETPHEIDRRTLVKGVAWSVPVVAMVATAPLAAASGVSIAFTQELGATGACDINTSGTIKVTGVNAPTPVTVYLPTGLSWADGDASSSKTLLTTATGDLSLAGLIRGTGVAGTYAVTASTPGAPTPAVSFMTTTTGKSAIWYSGNASTVNPADTAGVVVNPVELAVTAGYAYARDAAGGWYAHSGAVDGDWRKFETPAVDKIYSGEGGSGWGYALAGGDVYRGHPTNNTFSHLEGISGVTQFAQTGNRLFAVANDGKLYRNWTSWTEVTPGNPATTAAPYTTITDLTGNEGGGYGWMIADGNIYYMLDNNQYYLSTTTVNKPANPQKLAIGAGWAYALDADGTVWSHATASAGDWYQMGGLPGAATRIEENEGGNFVWALVDGKLYSGWGNGTGSGTFVDTGALPSPIVDFAVGAGWAYALLADGTVWSHAGAGAGTWNQMHYNAADGGGEFHPDILTTNYGNFSWFIAPSSQTCEGAGAEGAP